MTKNEARKEALALRKKKTSNNDVVKYIVDNHLIDSFNNIGIYYPIGTELDITELKALYKNKSFYLPITRNEISFVLYDGTLVKGRFHTMEPIGDVVSRDLIDCFIIPCVAVDKNNKRIGYGKGYYDRYLAGYKGYKLGVVYENCCFDEELCDDFDVTLDLVVKG